MSKTDYMLSVPLLWGLIHGYRKGFIIQIASLLALCIGVLGARYVGDLIAPQIINTLGVDLKSGKLIGFVFGFSIITISILLLAKLLELLIKIAMLGIINRLIGALFGLLKWYLIVSVFVAVYERLHVYKHQETSKNDDKSYLYPLCFNTGNYIISLGDK
ncbi:MAG: CvpA family protein [Bacteroidetes bacterium]|nr:CvpA family protein [Bacteroidota bacterium]